MKQGILFFLLFHFFAGFSQTETVDSLLQVLKQEKEDTNKVKTLEELGWELYATGDYNKSIMYGAQSKTLAEKLNYPKGVSNAYNIIGNSYYNLGNYPLAVEGYFKALSIQEKTGDKRGISNSYNNLGNIYDSQEKYNEALKYHLKALKLRKEINAKDLIAGSYHNLGLVYTNLYQSDLALKNFFSALELFAEKGDTLIMGSCYDHIGVVYFDKKDHVKSLEYALMALKIRETKGAKVPLAKSYVNVGACYEALGKYKEAENYSLKGLKLAREMEYLEMIQPVCETLSMIYAKTGKHEKALEFYKEFVAARDSLINEANTEKTVRLEMNYEFEKKETAAKLEQDKKEAIAAAVSKKQQIIIWAVSGLFLLAIIISILIVRQNKFRAEQRSMQLEQKLLRSQMNPHFIFNSLIAIESFIYRNEPKEAGKYLSGFARLMRLILENSREEFVPLEREIQTLEHYLKLQKLRYDDAFDYDITVEENIESSVTEIPPMLAQPFIENAIEHGLKGLEKKGHISIHFFLKHDELIFEVMDNGVGFERAKAKHKEDGHRSLAIAITQDRLKSLNKKNRNIKVIMSDIKDSTGMVSGAKVTFVVPYTKS